MPRELVGGISSANRGLEYLRQPTSYREQTLLSLERGFAAARDKQAFANRLAPIVIDRETVAGKVAGLRPYSGNVYLSLRDGRHRLLAAEAAGVRSIRARVVDEAGRTVYEGPLRLTRSPVLARVRANAIYRANGVEPPAR